MRGQRLPVGPELRPPTQRPPGHLPSWAAMPYHVHQSDLRDRKRLTRTDSDGSADRLDPQDVPRSAVRGPTHPKPLALADGEGMGALVLTDHLARGVVHDRPGCGCEVST